MPCSYQIIKPSNAERPPNPKVLIKLTNFMTPEEHDYQEAIRRIQRRKGPERLRPITPDFTPYSPSARTEAAHFASRQQKRLSDKPTFDNKGVMATPS
jgi:hypothetical protein